MRIKFLVLFCILFTSRIHAQNRVTRWGIQGGTSVNIASVLQDSFNYNKSFFSVYPSLVSSIHLGKVISLHPSISYASIGYRREEIVDSLLTLFLTNKLNNIVTPVHISANLRAGKGRLFINLGPQVNIGINGRTTVDSIVSGLRKTVELPFIFGNSSSEVKRLNLGSGFGLGYWQKAFELKANYGFLNDISKSNKFELDNVLINFSGTIYFLNNKRFWKLYKKTSD
jgi:hypothetical protein